MAFRTIRDYYESLPAPKPPLREIALAYANFPEALARRRVRDLDKAANVYRAGPDDHDIGFAYYNCPMALSDLEDDFYILEGRVYERGDDALCTRCRHQLACALNNGPGLFSFEDVVC